MLRQWDGPKCNCSYCEMFTQRGYSDQSRAFLPSRFVRARAFTPKQKNAGRRRNTRAMIGQYVIMC